MEATTQPRAWKVLLAFAIIYFVWGSTFLAIRVGVREVPPFLLAGMRFLVAGIVLYGWMRAKGTPSPTAREWGSASLLAHPDFCLRLRVALLGREARAIGNRCGDDGDDSRVHGDCGDRDSCGRSDSRSARDRSARGNWRSRGAGGPQRELRRSSDRHGRCMRA